MGGNPRLPAPDDSSPSDDPADWTSALHDAVSAGHLTALKLFKPSPELDDMSDLLSHIGFFGEERSETVEYLLGRGAEINNKPNGGSSILDSLFRSLHFRFSFQRSRWSDSSDLERIEKWTSRGARWVPDNRYDYRCIREAIRGLDAREAWKFVEVLASCMDAALLIDVCDTPKIRHLLEVNLAELKAKIDAINTRQQKAEERQRAFQRKLDQTTFVQQSPTILGIRETRVSRRRLYGEVWSKPMDEIAAGYRTTVEHLVTICSMHNIPKPKARRWESVSSGDPDEYKLGLAGVVSTPDAICPPESGSILFSVDYGNDHKMAVDSEGNLLVIDY